MMTNGCWEGARVQVGGATCAGGRGHKYMWERLRGWDHVCKWEGSHGPYTFWWMAAVVVTLTIIPNFCPARNPCPWITDITKAVNTRA